MRHPLQNVVAILPGLTSSISLGGLDRIDIKIQRSTNQLNRCRFIDFSSERNAAKAQPAHLNVGLS